MKKPTALQSVLDSSKKSVQISAVIPACDYEKLKRQAKKELTSQGHVVRRILHSHLLSIGIGGQ